MTDTTRTTTTETMDRGAAAMPDVDRTRMTETTRATTDVDDDERRRLQLREEQLLASKTREEAGEVGIRKEVISEERTIDVPVTREEVYIERHAVNQAASGPITDEGETIRVPIMEEHAQLEKQTVVREELEIGKRAVQETEQLQGTVRREEVRIETEGDVDVNRGASGTSRTSETRTTQDRGTGQNRS